MNMDAAVRTGLGQSAGLYVRETVLILAATMLLPFAVHTIPAMGAVPWGERLLPMFLAPFVGVFFFRLHVGLIPALLAPVLSHVLIGLPALPVVGRLTLELAVFTLLVYLVLRLFGGRARRFGAAAPLAYLLAKVSTAPVVAFVPAFGPGIDLVAALWVAIPGVLMLLAVNVALVEVQRRLEG